MGRYDCRPTLKADWVARAFPFHLAGNAHAALTVLRAWVGCSPHCCPVNPCPILGAVGDHACLPIPSFMIYVLEKSGLRGGTGRGSGSFRLLNQNRNKQNIWNSCPQSWYFLDPETRTQFTFSGCRQLCCSFGFKKIHDVLIRSWLQRKSYSMCWASQLYKTWLCHWIEGTCVKECADGHSYGPDRRLKSPQQWTGDQHCTGLTLV